MSELARKQSRGKIVYQDNHYGYPFMANNGGRLAAAKRFRGDCAVIALAIATGRSYDECVASFQEEAHTGDGGTYLSQWVHALEWQGISFYGFSFKRMTFPTVKGKPAMKAQDFCAQFPQGRFIVSFRIGYTSHAVACIDGVMQGEWPPRPTAPIYAAYKIEGGAS